MYTCPHVGMERLQVQPISRVQAIQRGGRAGRTGPGECWRLYTKAFYDVKMVDVSPPEIQRVPIAGAVLALKSLPASLAIDVLSFQFVDAPPRAALEEALRHLHLLGAIDAGMLLLLLSILKCFGF
jgi:HrpA-like RNA helicase